MTIRVEARRIGSYGKTSVDGPLVLIIAGLHGNEPGGVLACRRVLEALEATSPRFTGHLLALAGNRAALNAGRRYIEEDLNRIWLPERLSSAAADGEPPGTTEAREQRELLEVLGKVLSEFEGTAHFLDLHTTSAPGAPFVVFADTLANRKLAAHLPGTMVLGLEEHLDGTLLSYVNEIGHIAVGFEGGQHGSPVSVESHEAAIWRTLAMAGCIESSDVPRLGQSVEFRERQDLNRPRAVEIRYRHAVMPADEFRMNPGFDNLQPIVVGQVLARDRNGEIRSLETGRVLMPLYQSQGDDGFFVVREIASFWLSVSAWMRRLGLHRLLPLMPGVERHPEQEDTFVLDRTVARWLVVELCHLLGFRRKRLDGARLVVSRRREAPIAPRHVARAR